MTWMMTGAAVQGIQVSPPMTDDDANGSNKDRGTDDCGSDEGGE